MKQSQEQKVVLQVINDVISGVHLWVGMCLFWVIWRNKAVKSMYTSALTLHTFSHFLKTSSCLEREQKPDCCFDEVAAYENTGYPENLVVGFLSLWFQPLGQNLSASSG